MATRTANKSIPESGLSSAQTDCDPNPSLVPGPAGPQELQIRVTNTEWLPVRLKVMKTDVGPAS